MSYEYVRQAVAQSDLLAVPGTQLEHWSRACRNAVELAHLFVIKSAGLTSAFLRICYLVHYAYNLQGYFGPSHKKHENL